MKRGYTGWGLWDEGSRESSAEGGTEHRMASSEGTERRNGSVEDGDGKADVDVGGYGRVGTTLWKQRGRKGR